MANGGGFQAHFFGPAFLSKPDSYLCFGDEAVDSMLDTGGLDYDNYANPLPVFPSDVSTNASYGDVMLAIAAPAFPSTQEVDNMPQVGIQSHLRPPRIAYPETGDVNVQEAPVGHVHPEVPDETINDSHTTDLTSPVRTRYAIAEDWELHRALFTRLYRDENKTLKEVKSIMKEKYGFNATWVSLISIQLAMANQMP